MLNLDLLKQDIGRIDFREKRMGVHKVLAPFFHEDGDMFDIFVEAHPDGKKIRLSDYGLTLMKLSYVFDIKSDNKQSILEGIISQNRAELDNGSITLDILPQQFSVGLNQFAHIISKVSNMEIISREAMQSMFYEYLQEFIREEFKNYSVAENFAPTANPELTVDYKIDAQRPVFVFGVNENTKASKVVISCLNFNNQKIPYRSLIIHDDIDKLSKFNRAQITNIADKQFATLDGFREGVRTYQSAELPA